MERERFTQIIQYACKTAGAAYSLLADSGLELVHQASQGLPRQAGPMLRTTMQMAATKKLIHLPDELLQRAIQDLR